MPPSPTGDAPTLSRTERKRRDRERRFVDAAKRIVADEGFEALTMQRLSDDLDMAISAAYRYFPSKGALVRQVQMAAIEELSESLDAVSARADEAIGEAGLSAEDAALARLALMGRWFCAASESYPEDLRLLQMIMSQRNSTLDADGGWKVLPVAMALLARTVSVIAAAQETGVLLPANPAERAAILGSAIGGVLQTDDLEKYVPELFGRTRLAQQAAFDLYVGWGADREALARAMEFIDDLAAAAPLAP